MHALLYDWDYANSVSAMPAVRLDERDILYAWRMDGRCVLKSWTKEALRAVVINEFSPNISGVKTRNHLTEVHAPGVMQRCKRIHHPPCNPDFVQSDFQLFTALKKHSQRIIMVETFENNTEGTSQSSCGYT